MEKTAPYDVTVSVRPQSGEQERLSAADFAEQIPAWLRVKDMEGDLRYYVALDNEGVMQRVISNSLFDRKTVAATVGNWVADGYNVMQVGRKELAKHLRKLDSLVKESTGKTTEGDPEPGELVVPKSLEAAPAGGVNAPEPVPAAAASTPGTLL